MVAAENLLLLMLLYTLSRLFFYLISGDLFPNVSGAHLREMLLGGMRFDLTAVLYLSSLYLLLMLLPLPWKWRTNKTYQTVAKWCLWVPNILGLIVNCADMVYVRFTDRRTTMTFFSEFENDDNLLRIFLTGMVQYWYVTLFAILIVALLIIGTRTRASEERILLHPVLYYAGNTVLLIVSVYFIVIGIRGGFGAYTRPITMSNALQYTNRPEETMLVLNTPFSLMRSSEGRTYHDPKYYDREQLEQLMTPCHPNEQVIPHEMDRQNVVILILESFSKEYIGCYNRKLDNGTYAGYTPFLDSLLEHSISYRLSYASGRKSIDAMPSVLSSLPMLIAPYVVTAYSTNNVSSLAACLKPKGYATSFFHGAPNSSMGFQAYARSAGFDSYFGKDEYEAFCRQTGRNAADDYDGTWAIWDEEFLQFYCDKMSEMKQPFVTSVFTASSHPPYAMPERYKTKFPPTDPPIFASIKYSDNALRLFFEKVSKQEWFKNTVFVLTADHTSESIDPQFTSDLGRYKVPIVIYAPSLPELQGVADREKIISQTDIMPTILGILGYDLPYVAFGQDVLNTKKEDTWAVNYIPGNGYYQYMQGDWMLQFDGEKVVHAYRFKEDTLQVKDMKAQYPKEYENRLKSLIQQYMFRMNHNQLVFKK